MRKRAPRVFAPISSCLSSAAQPLLLLSLAALAPFARLYARNLRDDLAAAEIRHYAAAVVVVLCGIYLLLHLLVRPKTHRLSAVCATFVLVFFQFGEIADALANRGAGQVLQALGWCAVLLAALGVATGLGARAGFHRFLLVFAGLSLAVPAYEIVIAQRRPDDPASFHEPAYALEGNPIWSGTPVRRPNIYWIVVDSYPGRAVLRDDLRFDNGRFYRALARRGFYVAHASHANYSTTMLSISSTLEMEMLYEGDEDSSLSRIRRRHEGPVRKRRHRLKIIAGANRSVAFLKQLGYRYVHFEGLTYQATRCRGFEDVCLSGTPSHLSELESVLLAKVPYRLLGLFSDETPSEPRRWKKRERSESGTGIPELAAGIAELPVDRPYFLYAHIFSPHGPYHNDAKCNPIPARPMGGRQDFLNQLQCVNLQLTELLDQILRDAPDAIIFVSSDHGPRLSVLGYQSIFDYSQSQIREHLSILNAIRVPPTCRTHLKPDLSPINTLRLVFACLGGHRPRFIEDRYFIAPARPKHRDYGKIREVELR